MGIPNQKRQEELAAFARKLDLQFPDYFILHQAFIHRSFVNEHKEQGQSSNERLEFLGDAVLDLVIGEHLFRSYPELAEGQLSKYRSRLVCEATLADCAQKMALGRLLLLSKGEEATGGRQRPSLLADAVEALIGSVYLTFGLEEARRLSLDILQEPLQHMDDNTLQQDFKTRFQEWVQQQGEQKISYQVTNEDGPDHAKNFTVTLYVNDRPCGWGTGKSKKEAEQNAARQALERMNAD